MSQPVAPGSNAPQARQSSVSGSASVTIRPRVEADVPALVRILGDQQPTSGYPYRWPLPFPVEDFLVRSDELGAWTALIDQVPVGHIALRSVGPDDEDDNFGVARAVQQWSSAHGVGIEALACISAFVVRHDVRGHGLGQQLLDAAVAFGQAHGRRLCLDTVIPGSAAIRLYQKNGWVFAGEFRPVWLPDHAPSGVTMVLPQGRHPS